MKVLFILEAGIPEYRNFLFERLTKEIDISDLLVLHTGRTYNGTGNYRSKKLRFIGNNKFGFHLAVFKYIHKFDVVISSYNLRIITCWAPVYFKNKWIFWGKGLGSNDGAIVNFLRKQTAKKASRILVYNEIKKLEFIAATGVDTNKVIAYNNTVLIKNPGIENHSEKGYFLYFGRLQRRKGLEDLVKQYGQYVNNRHTKNVLKLRFVGNGEFTEELRKLVKQLNLTEMVEFFPGVYDDESIKNHFASAIAYVSPYNVGLAVINSFAYGVPVITCVTHQVGPEFHYLNKNNSFVFNNIEQLHGLLDDVGQMDLEATYLYCYEYYKNYLSSDIMYNHFVKAIKETYNE